MHYTSINSNKPFPHGQLHFSLFKILFNNLPNISTFQIDFGFPELHFSKFIRTQIECKK